MLQMWRRLKSFIAAIQVLRTLRARLHADSEALPWEQFRKHPLVGMYLALLLQAYLERPQCAKRVMLSGLVKVGHKQMIGAMVGLPL
jgi:hypothetical protein